MTRLLIAAAFLAGIAAGVALVSRLLGGGPTLELDFDEPGGGW